MKTPVSGPPIAAGPSFFRVVGCGNDTASDDALGIELVERLHASAGLSGPELCDFSVVPSAGPEMLDLMDAGGTILFVDAVSSGSPPGTLHLIPLPSTSIEAKPVSSLSSHGWGLLETIELARRLKPSVPSMFLLGIELASVELFGPQSLAVEQAMERVVEGFPHLVRLLKNPASPIWRGPERIFPAQRLPWEETCA
jgi:hydrogenase maturation protease